MGTQPNALPEGYVISSGNQHYRIVKILGCGGFGITYLATSVIKHGNLSFNVHFAVKEHFLSDSCERDATTMSVSYSNPTRDKVESSKKDFLAEARRLHKVGVDHPNIVKVNEVFEANNTAYYVMEYLEGQSLRGYVGQHGPLTEAGMWAIMTPVINAVAYLHDNRMTHLDIKPDNIMLAMDKSGQIMRPVLIDFGLSKHYTEDGRPTSTINALGLSNGYSPIEQYAGITTFSPEADVYALGATMLFCLTGKDPGNSIDLKPGDVERMIPDGISENTSRTIVEAMQLFKSARPADARALLAVYNNNASSADKSATKSLSAAASTIPVLQVVNEDETDNHTVTVSSDSGKSSSNRWIAAAAVTIVIAVAGFFLFGNRGKVEPVESDSVPAIVAEDTVAAPTVEIITDVKTETPVSEPVAAESDNKNKKLRPKKVNGKWGYVDSQGNIAIQPQWDTYASEFGSLGDSRLAVVTSSVIVNGDKRWYSGLIDKNGKYVIPLKYTQIYKFNEGVAYARCDYPETESVFYDKNGRIAFRYPEGYGNASNFFHQGLLCIRKAGTNIFGWCDRQGRIVIEPQYDRASDFNKAGIAFVGRNGKFGAIDKSNNIVVPMEYTDFQEWDSSTEEPVNKRAKKFFFKDGTRIEIDDYGNPIK